MSNPTGGKETTLARSGNHGWTPKPVAARLVRLLQVVLPFIAGWLAIRGLRSFFIGVDGQGWGTFFIWLIQAIFVATVISATVVRLVSRLTPLAALLNMSLVFPDSVPSRFGIALRTGTVKRLMAEPTLQLSASAQAAAEEAVRLVTHLGQHEPLTRGHTERVRAYADIIGQQMGLSDEDLNGLRWGALLHDVGKLTVPAEILNKPGKPTEQEWEVLRGHPGAAVSILEPLYPWLGDWLLAAPQHHERFDGEGYPSGISGREISVAGRIVAVADAFDVITSRRSYKKPKSAEFAREEMVRSAGTHFDPLVVRALLEAGVTRSWYGRRMGWLLELPGIARVLTTAGQVAATATVVVTVSAFLPSSLPPNTVPDSVTAPFALPFIESNAEELIAMRELVDGGSEGDGAEVVLSPTDPTNVDPNLGETTSVDLTTTSTSISTSTSVVVQSTQAEVQASSSTSSRPSVGQSPVSPTASPTTTTRATTTTSQTPATVTPATVTPTTRRQVTTTTVAATTTTSVAATTAAATTADCALILSGETFLPGADLRGCDLSNLEATGLHLANARLDGADLTGARLTDFNLEGANLSGATLSQAVLTRGSLRGADLSQATARRLTASEVGFQDADLTEVNFGGSLFLSTSFEGADIRQATLSSAGFENSNFRSADMRGMNLSFLDLHSIDFSNALIGQVNFKSSDLSGTVFAGATGVPSDVTAATFASTTCPDGTFSNSSCW